ncbi:MAG: hypothetical protein MK102_19540 [Fuerstiella sp.]|nr:hypothetical protein [Fuerstiella sp.]
MLQQADAVAEDCRGTRHDGDNHSLGHDHLQQAEEENPSRNSVKFPTGDFNMKASRGMFWVDVGDHSLLRVTGM